MGWLCLFKTQTDPPTEGLQPGARGPRTGERRRMPTRFVRALRALRNLICARLGMQNRAEWSAKSTRGTRPERWETPCGKAPGSPEYSARERAPAARAARFESTTVDLFLPRLGLKLMAPFWNSTANLKALRETVSRSATDRRAG